MLSYESVMGQQPVRMAECTPTSCMLIGDADGSRFVFNYDTICIKNKKLVIEDGPERYIFEHDYIRDMWRFYRVENKLTEMIDSLIGQPCKLRFADNKAYLTDINSSTHGIIVDVFDFQQYLRDETVVVTDLKSKSIDLILRTFYSRKASRIVTEIENVEYKWKNKE